jgi:TPR repeat protein
MVSLGLMLQTADHVPKDLKAAYALYQKAVDRSSADGAMDLANALFKGEGIDRDVPRAVTLIQRASDDGSARAAFDLAALIQEGFGGRPPGEALALSRQAAARRYPEGYRAAAVLLDEGRVSRRTQPPPPRSCCAPWLAMTAKPRGNFPLDFPKTRCGTSRRSKSFSVVLSRPGTTEARSTASVTPRSPTP